MSHPDYAHPTFNWLTSWSWDPLASVPLALSLTLYLRGLTRIWAAPAGRRSIRPWQASAFLVGWFTLVIALVSPLDVLSDWLFSAHMTQHELLMLVAAPLMVLGRPLVVMFWTFGPDGRSRVAGWIQHRVIAVSWRYITGPVTVWLLHAIALWIWHLPFLYQAALANDGVHAIQHVSFFATAALFWWAVAHGRYGRIGYGVAVLYVFTTAVHSGALGALVTFAPSLLYPAYAEPARAWGVDPLQDQELAGLIMWIPFSLTFLIVGLALFAAWLGESDRRLGYTGHAVMAGAPEEEHAR
jgi:putative membrane protein